MKKITAFLLFLSIAAQAAPAPTRMENVVVKGSLGVGSTSSPNSKVALDVISTTKAARPCPPMTTVQRDAISSPANGSCVFNTDTAALNNYSTGSSSWRAVGSGTGSGLKNYTSNNPDIEFGSTTGFSLGTVTLTNGFPSGVPSFGSGASGNLSIAASNSGPLAGTYSLTYASSAATTAGNMGCTDAFALDSEAQAHGLGWKFLYNASSGASNINFSGTSSNSYGVAFYDVTNTKWIQPAGVFNLVQSSGTGRATGTIQFDSNTTSVRFCVYNANATAGAATLKVDDFSLGPQVSVSAPAMSDWLSFTPTGSWVSNTTYAGYYRRVGDSAEIRSKLTLSGAPTAATLTVNLPSGLTIDAAKLNAAAQFLNSVSGEAQAFDNSAGTGYTLTVTYNSTTSVTVGYQSSLAAVQALVNATAPFTWANLDSLDLTYTVPIVGWSSNTASSADTATTVVSSAAGTNSSTHTSSGSWQTVTGFSANIDTNGSFNASTGIYTVGVVGQYLASGNLGFSPNSTGSRGARIRLNGNDTGIGYITTNAGASTPTNHSYSGLLKCVPGDQIILQGYQASGGNLTYQTDADINTRLSIQRLSGPAVVQAADTVSAHYKTGSGQSIPNSSSAIIDYGTKTQDTTASATTGSSWKFTAPISGTFWISASAGFSSASWTAANVIGLDLFKNGSIEQSLFVNYVFTTGTYAIHLSGGTNIRLLAGEYVDVRLFQNSGGARSMDTDANRNHISITRVGNY